MIFSVVHALAGFYIIDPPTQMSASSLRHILVDMSRLPVIKMICLSKSWKNTDFTHTADPLYPQVASIVLKVDVSILFLYQDCRHGLSHDECIIGHIITLFGSIWERFGNVRNFYGKLLKYR